MHCIELSMFLKKYCVLSQTQRREQEADNKTKHVFSYEQVKVK